VPGTDLSFTLDEVPAGRPDNLVANGQKLDASGLAADTTKVSFIGSASGGDTTGGKATVTYTDGSTAETLIEYGDWCLGGDTSAQPKFGNIGIVQSDYRNLDAGRDPAKPWLFATKPFEFAAGKRIASITLPSRSNLHIFAIAENGVLPPPDLTAPTTVAAVAPAQPSGAHGWWNTPVQVTLAATDDSGTVARSEYQLDGGAWTTVTAPFTVGADGKHEIGYRSVDQAGNVEATKVVAVQLDGTAPATKAAVSDGPESGVRLVTLTAADPTSGVDGTEYSLDGTVWQPYTEPFAVPMTTLSRTVKVRSTDVAGNVEPARSVAVTLACTSTVTGVVGGPLTVSAGVTCLRGATISGPTTVRAGATLIAVDSRISGPVRASGASVVSLTRATISGEVTITDSTGGVSLTGLTVAGPVKVTGSKGVEPAMIGGNLVSGPLTCAGNTPPPVSGGRPNTVSGPTTGQCKTLR